MKNAHVAGLISVYLVNELGFRRVSQDGRLLYEFRCACGCGKIHKWSSERPDALVTEYPNSQPEVEPFDISDIDAEAFAEAIARDRHEDCGWDFEKAHAAARYAYTDGEYVQ